MLSPLSEGDRRTVGEHVFIGVGPGEAEYTRTGYKALGFEELLGMSIIPVMLVHSQLELGVYPVRRSAGIIGFKLGDVPIDHGLIPAPAQDYDINSFAQVDQNRLRLL